MSADNFHNIALPLLWALAAYVVSLVLATFAGLWAERRRGRRHPQP